MREFMYKNLVGRLLLHFLFAATIVVLSGCGDTFDTAPTVPANPTNTNVIANLQASATPTTVKSDNSNSSIIKIAAVNSGNAAVPNETITLSTDTGLLSAGSVVTDATGIATASFSSGTFEKANRTATITATFGAVSSLLPVQIVGSTVSLSIIGTTALLVGSPQLVTITAKDAGGTAISGAAVVLSQTGGGAVAFSPASGTTDASGKLTVTVTGVTAGAVTVSAAAVGATATIGFTVTSTVATTFGINLLTLNGGVGVVPSSPKTSSMKIGDNLAIRVNAPTSTKVIFASTVGTWVGVCALGSGQNTCTVTVVGGVATATLVSAVAGSASVQVLDPLNSALNDNLTVGITASTPAKITMQGSPTVIPMSVGSTVGYSSLTAMVYDATGAPVGGAPVAFSIVPGTGTSSGETISPVVVFTNSTGIGGNLGEASTTFTSGSLSSGGQGVQIRASVVGTTVATQSLALPATTTSSFDVAIVVGGSAGSVAFGQATVAEDGITYYIYPMSVMVADANGNPAPQNTVVNISAWPIAWSTGQAPCFVDPDGYKFDGTGFIPGDGGTFLNEDVNENTIVDANEDGKRLFYATGTATAVPTTAFPAPKSPIPTGTLDGQLTPLNSYGGTVSSLNSADLPGTVTTDAAGIGRFNLTYPKSSAIWVVTRIRAQTKVQGTPAVGQLEFRLRSIKKDVDPDCLLQPSPFKF